MRRAFIIFAGAVTVGLVVLAVGLSRSGRQMPETAMVASLMSLTSSAFTSNSTIPVSYTCKGDDTNPPLTINRPPATTKSFVLIFHDLDAPGGNFNHWLAWNIPPDTTTIAANSLPPGALQGHNDFGSVGYRGPCPPTGQHRYAFDIYALDTRLKLKTTITQAELQAALKKHVLGQARLLGLYTKGM